MLYSYPCLYDYIKEDISLIDCVTAIFDEIKTLSGVIFSAYDSELLREMGYGYYYERYKRPLKVLYDRYCKNSVDWTDSDSVEAFFKHIAKVAYNRFGGNWERIYNAYFILTYNPLENYDMTQTRTPDLDYDTKVNRDQSTKVETDAKTKVVPFNATNPTLTGESEGESTTTEAAENNEISTHTDETGTDTLTRHGNIGVTTSQQMLQSELDLRRLDFQKLIFDDLDKVLLRNYMPYGDFFPL